MKSTRVLIIAIPLLLTMIAGCYLELPYMVDYRWTAMRAASLDNSGREPIPAASGRVPASAYGLRLMFTALFSSPEDTITTNPVSPVADGQISYQRLDTVRSLTVGRMASPGSGNGITDVTEDFFIRDTEGNPSLDQFSRLDAYFRDEKTYWRYIDTLDMFLIDNIHPIDSARFIIAMTLSNGKTFIDTTDYVVLY